uniref:Uncharacterized protein n=1 Tax=Nelumbo nucifera TaxID=4432 RepID=A0A822ZQ05_NELNU|nr:TPA_asm: hypothetical protein HUJ06_002108 [Nelumbo nucifera]
MKLSKVDNGSVITKIKLWQDQESKLCNKVNQESVATCNYDDLDGAISSWRLERQPEILNVDLRDSALRWSSSKGLKIKTT